MVQTENREKISIGKGVNIFFWGKALWTSWTKIVDIEFDMF
jgi:hypothetical protein